MTTATKKIIRVGLDLGTNTSVFQAAHDGKVVSYERNCFPSLVGYPKPGIIPGILPTDDNCLFGDLALEYRLHLDLRWPLKDGFIDNLEVCRDFASFLRTRIDEKDEYELATPTPSGLVRPLLGLLATPAFASLKETHHLTYKRTVGRTLPSPGRCRMAQRSGR